MLDSEFKKSPQYALPAIVSLGSIFAAEYWLVPFLFPFYHTGGIFESIINFASKVAYVVIAAGAIIGVWQWYRYIRPTLVIKYGARLFSQILQEISEGNQNPKKTAEGAYVEALWFHFLMCALISIGLALLFGAYWWFLVTHLIITALVTPILFFVILRISINYLAFIGR